MTMLPPNKLSNVKRRAFKAFKKAFPHSTCPASRSLLSFAEIAATIEFSTHILWDKEDVQRTMYSVLESLWKARMELNKLRKK